MAPLSPCVHRRRGPARVQGPSPDIRSGDEIHDLRTSAQHRRVDRRRRCPGDHQPSHRCRVRRRHRSSHSPGCGSGGHRRHRAGGPGPASRPRVGAACGRGPSVRQDAGEPTSFRGGDVAIRLRPSRRLTDLGGCPPGCRDDHTRHQGDGPRAPGRASPARHPCEFGGAGQQGSCRGRPEDLRLLRSGRLRLGLAGRRRSRRRISGRQRTTAFSPSTPRTWPASWPGMHQAGASRRR